jgi:hypothetical protein
VRILRTTVLLLAFLAAAYDLGSVAWTSLTVHTVADDAAVEAVTEWEKSQDVDAAHRVANARAAEDDLSIAPADFVVEPDGTVRLRIHTVAHTLVARLVGPLREHTRLTADGVAKAVL